MASATDALAGVASVKQSAVAPSDKRKGTKLHKVSQKAETSTPFPGIRGYLATIYSRTDKKDEISPIILRKTLVSVESFVELRPQFHSYYECLLEGNLL